MPIVRDARKAREIITSVKHSGNTLPCFCTENVITTEAVFQGAQTFKNTLAVSGHVPVFIAVTASYPERKQLLNYSSLHDYREGFLAFRNDVERLARPDGPYPDLDVIVHLDHAQPGSDDWIFEENDDFISSVMYDCSHYPLDENIRMVQEFVSRHKDRLIVEGCVDEIYASDSGAGRRDFKDTITTAEDACRYFEKTGVDLLVANLGTEHRRTAGALKHYHREAAREISAKIGRQLVLHGTSCLNRDDIKNVPDDGIVKVNIWTILEVLPGQNLVKECVRNVNRILDADQIAELVNEHIIDPVCLKKDIKPDLDFLTGLYRRDSVLIPETAALIQHYYSWLYRSIPQFRD